MPLKSFVAKQFKRTGLIISCLLIFAGLFSGSASATNHFVRISEIMAGLNGDSSIQFVEMVVTDAGQKAWGPQGLEPVGRAMLAFFDENGAQTGRYVVSNNPVGGVGNTVLFATQAFADLTGVIPDFIIPPLLSANAGRVCFQRNPDSRPGLPPLFHVNICLTYGGPTFSGPIDTSGAANNMQLEILNSSSLSRFSNFNNFSGDATIPGNPQQNAHFAPAIPTPASSRAGFGVNFQNNILGEVVLPTAAPISDQGRVLFLQETFEGNGRTCGTCHTPNDSFGLKPSTITLLPPNDPLFIHEQNINILTVNANGSVVPLSANGSQPSDFRVGSTIVGSLGGSATILAGTGTTYFIMGGLDLDIPGNVISNPATIANPVVNIGTLVSIIEGNLPGPSPTSSDIRGLEDSAFLRGIRALITENINGFNEPAFLRGSPSLLNLEFTAPYGLSGEFPTLQAFAIGAVAQHFPRDLNRIAGQDFRQPTPAELDAMTAFQNSIVSVQDRNFDEINGFDRFATTEMQKAGRDVFFDPTGAACSLCHNGPVLASPLNLDTGVAAQPINQIDGLPTEQTVGAPPNSRAFNVPELFDIRLTAPYFHDHSASTLQEAVEFYDSPSFQNSPNGRDIPPGTLNPVNIQQIVAFLESLTEVPFTFDRTVNFATVVGGDSKILPVNIANTNDPALTISNINFTGVDAAEFSASAVQPDAGPVPNGGTRFIDVTFLPPAGSPDGPRQAIMEFDVSDGAQTYSVGVQLIAEKGIPVPEIDVTPLSVNFGNQDIALGATSPVAVNITNTGTGSLNVTNVSIVGAAPGVFVISSDTGELAVEPGSSRVVSVAFDPVVTGIQTASLQIQSDDSDEATVLVTLNGNGVELQPEIDVTPLSIDFGDQPTTAGGTLPVSVTISNSGTGPLDLLNVSVVGIHASDFLVISDTGQTILAPGESRVVSIVFDSILAGPRSAALQVQSTDADEATVLVSLTGNGVQLQPEIDVSPLSLNFGNQNVGSGGSTPRTVFITNTGGGPLNIFNVLISGNNPGSFFIIRDSGETTLAPGASRLVSIIFDPLVTGPNVATLDILSSDLDEGVTSIPLSGTGTQLFVDTINISPLSATVALGSSQTYLGTGSLGGIPVDPALVTSNMVCSATSFGGGGMMGGAGSSFISFNNVLTPPNNGSILTPTLFSVVCRIGTVTSNAVQLTVTDAELISIAITPNNPLSLALDQIQQFRAAGLFSDGSTRPIAEPVLWLSSDTTVVAIDPNGIAVAAGLGSATISAQTLAGISSNTVDVQVSDSLLQVRINEVMAGLNANSKAQFVELVVQDDASKLWGPQGGETFGRLMLEFSDRFGTPTGRFVVQNDPASGPGTASTVLFGTEVFQTESGITPDFIIPTTVMPVAGKVCVRNNPDNPNASIMNICLSYGGRVFVGDTETLDPAAFSDLPIMDSLSLSRVVTDPSGSFGSRAQFNGDFDLRIPTPSSTQAGITLDFPANILGEVVLAGPAPFIEQGRKLFMEETFLGNGRTCATCHVEGESFGLPPAHVTTLPPSDLLFVNDINVNTIRLTASSQPSDLRIGEEITDSAGNSAMVVAGFRDTYQIRGGEAFGVPGTLVSDGQGNTGQVASFTPGDLTTLEDTLAMTGGRALITENINGFREAPFLRSSPTLLNIRHSAPFGLSGEFPTLQIFSAGAVAQHFPRSLNRIDGVDFRSATPQELDAMTEFQNTIVNIADENFDELNNMGRFATTELQKRGQTLYFGIAKCSVCHGGTVLASSNGSFGTTPGVNENFNTGVTLLPINDSLPTEQGIGQPADSREFNTPTAFGLRFTAPFFHDSSVDNLQDAIRFYDSLQFRLSPAFQQVGAIDAVSVPGNAEAIEAFLNALVDVPFTFTRNIDFGLLPAGSAQVDLPVEIVNPGRSGLTIVNAVLTGPNASEFTHIPVNSVLLSPGLGFGFNVSFNPRTPGIKEAILEFEVSDGTETYFVGVALTAEVSAPLDDVPPVVTPPVDITVEATGLATPVVPLGISSAIDDVDGVLVATPDQTGPFLLGSTQITWSATDAAGNVGTAVQFVTVQDTTPPQLSIPADVSVTVNSLPTTVDLGIAGISEIFFPVDITPGRFVDFTTAGVHTVVWTASDANGNETTGTQQVTIVLEDINAPVVTAPANITTEATDILTPVQLGTATAVDDITPLLTPVPDNRGPFAIDSTTVTWSATDAAGNTGTAVQVVTIVDTTTPVLTVPADIGVESATPIDASTIDIGLATATDIFPVSISNNAPLQFPLGTTVVVWTATDANGNATSGNQNVTVNLLDIVPPTVTAPQDINAEATAILTPVVLGTGSATDAVDGEIVPEADNLGPYGIGTTPVTWSARDTAGNTGSDIQSVTISDTTPPVLTLPANVAVDVNTAGPVTLDIGVATATDIFPVTVTSDSPATFPVGVTNVTWTAVDANGNSTAGVQIVTVNLVDIEAPVITPPADAIFEATGILTAGDIGAASATDNIDAVVTPVADNLGPFSLGETPVTWTASDAAGNTSAANQLVIVQDTTNPVLTLPADVSVDSAVPVIITDIGSATATDIFSVTISNDVPDIFQLGPTIVTWTATDSNGNVSTGAQTVTVNFVDRERPVVTAPAGITRESTGFLTPIDIGTATVTDNSGEILIASPDSVGPFPVGEVLVTWSARDSSGNVGIATQTITVVDTTLPVLTVPADITVGSAIPLFIDIGRATATDLFPVTVVNDAPRLFPIGATTVTWTATDANNNAVSDSQIITVNFEDTDAPVVTAPADITQEATGALTDVDIGLATVVDNSGEILSVSPDQFGPFGIGETLVTWSATDSSGNTGTAIQVISVVDTTAPVLTVPGNIAVDSAVPLAIDIGQATATDLFPVTVFSNAPDLFPVGETVVTWTASDANNNVVSGRQLVTVNFIDTGAPVVVPPNDIQQEATDILTPVDLGTGTADDEVDGPLVPTALPVGPFPVGTTDVVWSATDSSGNVGRAVQNVTIVDTTAPVLTVPADVTASTDNNNPIVVVIGDATATDIFTVTVTNDAPALFSAGATTVTWTATDGNGNTSSGTQRVTVTLNDRIAPVVTAPGGLSVEANAVLTPVVLGIGSADDNVDGPITPLADNAGPFPFGETTVNWNASDKAGNTGTAAQLITITDVTTPVVTAPADISIESVGPVSVGDVQLGTPTVTEIFQFTVDNGLALQSQFPVGTSEVIWTVTDEHGNTGTASQRVTVIALDVENPVVTAPANVKVEASDVLTPVDLGTASVTDNVDAGLVATADQTGPFAIGITTVTWRVSDSAGNPGSAQQIVEIRDTTAPVLSVPADISVTSNSPIDIDIGRATATDIFTVSITNNAPEGLLFPVGSTSVEWTATDANGNVSTGIQLVTVALSPDSTAPVITSPTDINVEASAILTTVNIGTATATDDRDGVVPVTADNTGPFPFGQTTVTWSASDSSGNTATAAQSITVVDTTSPVLQVPGDINVNGAGPVQVDIGQATASDIFDVVISNNAPALFPVGSTAVEWLATDANGNSVSAVQTITVIADTQPIRASIQPVVTSIKEDEVATLTVTATNTTGEDVTDLRIVYRFDRDLDVENVKANLNGRVRVSSRRGYFRGTWSDVPAGASVTITFDVSSKDADQYEIRRGRVVYRLSDDTRVRETGDDAVVNVSK